MLDFVDVLEVDTRQCRVIPRAWLDIDCCGQAAASALSAPTPD